MTNDPPRPAATSPDDHTLTVEEAALRYEHAGHPRTDRRGFAERADKEDRR